MGITKSAQGGNIRALFPDLKDKKWIIYAFEANKFFDEMLTKTKNNVEKLGHTIYLYKQTAAWIYNGKIDFYLDTINKQADYWGSSLNKNHHVASFIFKYFSYDDI